MSTIFDNMNALNNLGLRTGKTHVICEAANKINATVITFSEQEAARLRRDYGVKSTSMYSDIRGTTGPFLVDTQAVSMYAIKKEQELDSLRAENEKLKADLKIAIEALEFYSSKRHIVYADDVDWDTPEGYGIYDVNRLEEGLVARTALAKLQHSENREKEKE